MDHQKGFRDNIVGALLRDNTAVASHSRAKKSDSDYPVSENWTTRRNESKRSAAWNMWKYY